MLPLTTVSAADDIAVNDVVSTDVVVMDDIDEYLNDSVLGNHLSDSDKNTPVSNDDTSFSQLANDIANAYGSGVLTLSHDYVYDSTKDISYQTGINITSNLTINGNNQIINGLNSARAFYIYDGVTLIINNLTLTNCTVNSGSYSYGGAIYNNGDLNITDCTFTYCVATSGSTFSDSYSYSEGGAIYNGMMSSLNVIDSTFTYCVATSGSTFSDSYSYSEGGAIYKDYGSSLNVIGCTFTYCVATSSSTSSSSKSYSYGGVIYNYYGSLNVTDSTFTNCTADSSSNSSDSSSYSKGGAIFNYHSNVAVAGSIFTYCTVISSSNDSYSYGGAIYNYDGSLNVAGSIFDDCTSSKGTIFIDGGDYDLNGNYWSMNCTDESQFIAGGFISNGTDYIVPDNWVLMSITVPKNMIYGNSYKFTVALDKLCSKDGNIIPFNGTLPNYTAKIYNTKVYLTDGVGYYTYKAATTGTFTVVAKSIYSGKELARVKFTVTTNYVTIKQIITAANYLKNYGKKYKKLPTTVKIGSVKCTIAQASYLMTAAYKYYVVYKKSINTKIKVINVKATAKNTKGEIKSYKNSYTKIFSSLYSKGLKGSLPTTIKVNGKTVGFNQYTFALAKVISFSKIKYRLPNYVIFSGTYKVYAKGL